MEKGRRLQIFAFSAVTILCQALASCATVEAQILLQNKTIIPNLGLENGGLSQGEIATLNQLTKNFNTANNASQIGYLSDEAFKSQSNAPAQRKNITDIISQSIPGSTVEGFNAETGGITSIMDGTAHRTYYFTDAGTGEIGVMDFSSVDNGATWDQTWLIEGKATIQKDKYIEAIFKRSIFFKSSEDYKNKLGGFLTPSIKDGQLSQTFFLINANEVDSNGKMVSPKIPTVAVSKGQEIDYLTPQEAAKAIGGLQEISYPSNNAEPPSTPITNTPVTETEAPAIPVTEAPVAPGFVDASIQTAIGNTQYEALSSLIDNNGNAQIEDYNQAGQGVEHMMTDNVVIEKGSFAVKATADTTFKNIVTATATYTDPVTNEVSRFPVVYNQETNKLVRVVEIQTDVTQVDNWTYFNDIDKLVSSGDLNLIFLAQGHNADSFPATTKKPQYWVVVNSSQAYVDGANRMMYSLRLDNHDKTGYKSAQTIDSQLLQQSLFTRDQKSWRPAGFIRGKTSEGKMIRLLSQVRQNDDGSNIFFHSGIDDFISAPNYNPFDANKNYLASNYNDINILPIFALPENIDPLCRWIDYGDYNMTLYPNIYTADLQVNQGLTNFYDALPADMRQQIADNVRSTTSYKNPGPWLESFQLVNGIPPDIAKMISTRILYPDFQNPSFLQP